MIRALLSMDAAAFPLVFGPDSRRRLADLIDVDLTRPDRSPMDLSASERHDIELLVTGWGAPSLGARELDALPRLRAIVHWGGGVGFLDPSATQRGIAVSSARAANAVPVAEFTLAMIVLAAKDAFWVSRDYTHRQEPVDREVELAHTGLFDRTIGVVGASSIGTLVLQMLQSHDVNTVVFDPFATTEQARSLGAQLTGDLVDLARRSSILTVHAPELPQTRGMISRKVLAALPDGATVINTARGSLIDQEALVEELRDGRLRAVLDVTEPDVLPAGHPLYSLPNVYLTPHLAGSTGSELLRLGAAAVSEVERFVAGIPFAHPILP